MAEPEGWRDIRIDLGKPAGRRLSGKPYREPTPEWVWWLVGIVLLVIVGSFGSKETREELTPAERDRIIRANKAEVERLKRERRRMTGDFWYGPR